MYVILQFSAKLDADPKVYGAWIGSCWSLVVIVIHMLQIVLYGVCIYVQFSVIIMKNKTHFHSTIAGLFVMTFDRLINFRDQTAL